MPAMKKSEIGTLKGIPIYPTTINGGRRRPVRSRTLDTFLHILSICYADSSHIIQNPDKGNTHIGSVTKIDVIPTDMPMPCHEQMPMDETRVVLDTQENGLCNKQVESPELDHNISEERKDLSHNVDISPSISFDIKNPDNRDMVISSPHLITDKDVEEGQMSGELINFMSEDDTQSVDKIGSEPKDFIGTKTGLGNDNNLISLFSDKNVKDMVGVVNEHTRCLVDYSDIIVHGKSRQSSKQLTAAVESSNLKNNATKNQDLVYQLKNSGARNSKKRDRSCPEEERTNKKAKKSIDPTTSQQVVDVSANQEASNEKIKKRSLTKERKAKKKMKERIKRAEKNRKLGVKRLKLQPLIKEKKVSFCRHYMKGRCQEGENCKFSHDTIPLTKSKPCCHFARHACMKGDDCPFDHQLSKYPCNNYSSTGFCSRGSDCMFSHEAQPCEAPLNAPNESKPPSKSGSTKIETKSSSVPKSVEITPKLSARPPKGLNFISQEKLPLESGSSPKVHAEVKEITKTLTVIQDCKEITKTPPTIQDSNEINRTPPVIPRGINFLSFGKRPGFTVIQDSKEITKTPPTIQDSNEINRTPPVIPRGINFLSFGKRPGLDHSNGGFGKPRMSNLEGEGLKSMVNVVNEVKVDIPTDRPSSSQKPIVILPFMSSISQKALQSTLDFASKFDSGVKTNRPANLVQKL